MYLHIYPYFIYQCSAEWLYVRVRPWSTESQSQTLQLSYAVCVCILLPRLPLCTRAYLPACVRQLSGLFPSPTPLHENHISWTGATSFVLCLTSPMGVETQNRTSYKNTGREEEEEGEDAERARTASEAQVIKKKRKENTNANDACIGFALIFHRPAQPISGAHVHRGASTSWPGRAEAIIGLKSYILYVSHSHIDSKNPCWQNAARLSPRVGPVQRLHLSLPWGFSFVQIGSFLKQGRGRKPGQTSFLFQSRLTHQCCKTGRS